MTAAANEQGIGPPHLRLAFTCRPGQFVDLDSLVETTLAGLRDAGWYQRGLINLDALLATRAEGPGLGVLLRPESVDRAAPPGPIALALDHHEVPRERAAKLAWRDRLAAAWGGRPPLDETTSWVDVRLAIPGSLLGGLEPLLDALEPVLGRDPRGRQELFPNDHLVTWLRVSRAHDGPPVRLCLGAVTEAGPTAGDAARAGR